MPLSGADTSHPIGWFQICWSAELAPGEVRPVRFCGHDLVVYRSDDGKLSALDGHCLHLGAHLGYGGCVRGDEIVCPFHNWQWGADGLNTVIPGQDRPNRSAGLRVWPVAEAHGCVFAWHHPRGDDPAWPAPDIFAVFPGEPGEEADAYYPPHPLGAVRHDGVGVVPRVTADNVVDNRHFQIVHGTRTAEMLDWTVDESLWHTRLGFRSPRSGEITAVLCQSLSGIGVVLTYQTGKIHQRVMLSTTPVDAEHSDLLLTSWVPRVEGDPDGTSPEVAARYAGAAAALPQDIAIWNHQRFVERPLMARYEARPLGEFRKWARRFTPAPA